MSVSKSLKVDKDKALALRRGSSPIEALDNDFKKIDFGVSTKKEKETDLKEKSYRHQARASIFGWSNIHDGYGRKTAKPRIINKHGDLNVRHKHIKRKKVTYLRDLFTTLLDIKWRYALTICVAAFILSWVVFAVIWWIIGFQHGDFLEVNRRNETWGPCVHEVYDFTTALLFSIETQHTIGYGSRATAPNCPIAIIVMMLQSCTGVFIGCLMTGVAFAKLSRPKRRGETLLFSKKAVICKRDGQMCFIFRVVNLRKSHLVEAQLRIIMVKKMVTEEGEEEDLHQYEMVIREDFVPCPTFVVWPVDIEHQINHKSPLWDIGPDDLKDNNFEIHVFLEANVESTGMTAQCRTSYLPSEIEWGHRFAFLTTSMTDKGHLSIDYSTFHDTVPMQMEKCSAKEMASNSPVPSTSSSDVASTGSNTKSYSRLSSKMTIESIIEDDEDSDKDVINDIQEDTSSDKKDFNNNNNNVYENPTFVSEM